jgi:hypothetical protein
METARLLPFSRADSPFGLHLVLDPSAPAGVRSPWVSLAGSDDAARVLLAAIRGGGEAILLCALKLLPDSPPGADSRTVSPETNLDLEERWTRERRRLAELRALSPFFPRLVEVDPALAGLAEALPPLLYCRPSRTFLRPPCPACREPLLLCRDDGWLSARGLPTFSGSPHRILFCPTCSRGAATPAVYSISTLATDLATVGSPDGLLADLGRALRETWTEEEGDGAVGEVAARAVRALGQAPGSAGPDFREVFLPFTFCGSPYLLTAASAFDLDGLADALGGRPLDEAGPGGQVRGTAVPVPWASLAPDAPPTRRFLFAPEGTGLDAVEVLFLKLTAFRQIFEALVEWYRAASRPHLDLHPRHLLFDVASDAGGLPAFWTLRARLHGVASAVTPLPVPDATGVSFPGRSLSVPYAAPEVREFHLAGERPAEVVLAAAEPEGRGRFRLRGRLSDPYGLFPPPLPHDAILLSFADRTVDLGVTAVVLRADPGRSRSDETAFTSDPVAIDEAALRRLKAAFGARIPGAKYRIFPNFGAPADLYSLGIVLLRLLLVNDSQDLPAVVQAVERVAREIGGGSPATSRRPVSLAHLLARVPDAAPRFAKAQIFWAEEDRMAGRPNAIPDPLWEQVVLLALRLATRVAGFSTAVSAADFDPLFREEKLERVLPEILSIAGELQALLFDRQTLHLEIQQVLAEILLDEAAPEARP